MTSTRDFDFNFGLLGGYLGGDMSANCDGMFLGEPQITSGAIVNDPPMQVLGGEQCLGWQSPTTAQFSASLQDLAEEGVWSGGAAAGDLPAEPSKEDLAAEVAALKARLAQFETPKTPSPRKRTASRAFDAESSPPTRLPPLSTEHGPIEAMWSPDLTQGQRHNFSETQTSSPAAMIPSTPTPNSAKKRRTSKKEDAAVKKTPTKKTPAKKTSDKKQMKKRTKHAQSPTFPTFSLEDGQLTLSAEALRQPIRSVAEILDMPFDSLSHIEKATMLLPMLQGLHPLTGQKLDAAGSLALESTSNTLTEDSNGYNSEDLAQLTDEPLDQDFTGAFDHAQSTEQTSQSFELDFTNSIDPEEHHYIEDIAGLAYFNDATTTGLEIHTEVPTIQALFTLEADFGDISSFESNNHVGDASVQESPFSDSLDHLPYTAGTPFNQMAPENDDFPVHLFDTFNNEPTSIESLVSFGTAGQTAFDQSDYDFEKYDINNGTFGDLDFEFLDFDTTGLDSINESHGAERQREALEKYQRTGGRRR